jgi:hypothetical protein
MSAGPDDHEIDAFGRRNFLDLIQRGQFLDHDREHDFAVRLRHMLLRRDFAEVGRARTGCHAALAERRVANGAHRGARRLRIVHVRQLYALHAHVEQTQDKGRIEARRAHDRRDAHALGRHYHQLHVAQIEARVLEIDEGGVETGMADDFDDLGIRNAAHISAQRHAAFAHYPFCPVLFHAEFLCD